MPRLRRRRRAERARADPASFYITIIGLGPIGRELAAQLAALGVARLRLIDAGRVTQPAQLTEGYDADDIGRLRAHVTAERCHRINPQLDIRTSRGPNLARLSTDDAVFDCAGSMRSGLAILRTPGDPPAFWAGARIVMTTIHILTACDGRSRRACIAAIRSDASELAEIAPAPSHNAAIAAGLLAEQFVHFLDRRRPPPHICFKLDALRAVRP